MAGNSRQRGRTPQKQSGGGSTPLGCIGGILQTLITAVLAPVAPWIMAVVGVVLALDVVITQVKPLRALLGSMPITRALFAPILPWVIGAGIVLAISWLLRNGPDLIAKWNPYLTGGRQGRIGEDEDVDWARGEDAPGGGWGDKPPLTRPGGTRRQAPEPRQAEPPQRRQRTRPAPRQAQDRARRQRTRP